jgi:hypothetical protein
LHHPKTAQNLSAEDHASHAQLYKCLKWWAQILPNILFVNKRNLTRDGINNTGNFLLMYGVEYYKTTYSECLTILEKLWNWNGVSNLTVTVWKHI